MGFFKKLAKAAINVVVLPVELVKDAVTLGGAANGQGESYTGRRCREIARNAEEAYDELDKD